MDNGRQATDERRPERGTAIVVRRQVTDGVDPSRGLVIKEQRYRAGVARRYDTRTGPWLWD